MAGPPNLRVRRELGIRRRGWKSAHHCLKQPNADFITSASSEPGVRGKMQANRESHGLGRTQTRPCDLHQPGTLRAVNSGRVRWDT